MAVEFSAFTGLVAPDEKTFEYIKGKPKSPNFYTMVTPDNEGHLPERTTVVGWMKQWKPQADVLDDQIRTELEKRMIKEKVEMLSRHADLGKQMQDLGIEFITDEGNKDSLTSATAVRLLVAGVEIERDSRGLPEALEKLLTQSDEKILDRIKELTKNAPVEISLVE